MPAHDEPGRRRLGVGPGVRQGDGDAPPGSDSGSSRRSKRTSARIRRSGTADGEQVHIGVQKPLAMPAPLAGAAGRQTSPPMRSPTLQRQAWPKQLPYVPNPRGGAAARNPASGITPRPAPSPWFSRALNRPGRPLSRPRPDEAITPVFGTPSCQPELRPEPPFAAAVRGTTSCPSSGQNRWLPPSSPDESGGEGG